MEWLLSKREGLQNMQGIACRYVASVLKGTSPPLPFPSPLPAIATVSGVKGTPVLLQPGYVGSGRSSSPPLSPKHHQLLRENGWLLPS